ncbi:MAG: anti-sigma factor antagonist [Planctomycetaceae bacterium]|nr:anti-sigma factor antagonist [Planctomycetaceae bacterium]
MDASQSFSLERHSEFARLAISPELNAFHWADVERSAAAILTALEAAKVPAVIVDLSSLEYLGSAQVTLLVRVWKAIKTWEGRMVVLVTAPVVREVLKTAGLTTLWEFADSNAAAYDALGLQSDGRPRMSMTLPIVGLVALAGGLAGVCASLLKTEGLDSRVSLIVQLCCSAVALAAGLWTIIRGTGFKRGLGVGMVVASALLAVVEAIQAPR